MKKLFLKNFCFLLLLFAPVILLAQDLKDLELAPSKTNRIKQLKIKKLSDLQRLTPFESVSVIQKRYLPKTFRGELNLSFSSVINHTYFYLGGLSARAGYFLTEDHGFGVEGLAFPPAFEKQVTKNLKRENGLVPYTLSFSQFYGGAYYKWSPIFGKFSMLNRKIIYFDMYMTMGAGFSRVVEGLTEQDKKELNLSPPRMTRDFFPTISFGLGQVFAISQNFAFAWELKWLYTIIQFEGDNLYTPTDINLFLGVNYYFPGAGYR